MKRKELEEFKKRWEENLGGLGEMLNSPWFAVSIKYDEAEKNKCCIKLGQYVLRYWAQLHGVDLSPYGDKEITTDEFKQAVTKAQTEMKTDFEGGEGNAENNILDAKKGKFDLIITREVSRFARNTVDTLSYTRELKARGVDVFFINDSINTATNDGELRLTIMSSMAQDESRKISERVKAGQKISREKHVLYGSGNILGYRRENGTYVPDPDQAETVRLIFQMYSTGENGLVKIVNELYRLGRLDAGGHVSWDASKVSRVLHNATYKGCICYNKSHSDGYLTQKRVKKSGREQLHLCER